MNFSVVIPAYAQDVLQSGAAGYGFLMAASGVGSLLAALSLAFGNGAQVRRIAYGAILLGRRRDRPRRCRRSTCVSLGLMVARRVRRPS